MNKNAHFFVALKRIEYKINEMCLINTPIMTEFMSIWHNYDNM